VCWGGLGWLGVSLGRRRQSHGAGDAGWSLGRARVCPRRAQAVSAALWPCRFPADGFLLLALLLYAPVGLCLLVLRLFIGVHVFLVSCALPDSVLRRCVSPALPRVWSCCCCLGWGCGVQTLLWGSVGWEGCARPCGVLSRGGLVHAEVYRDLCFWDSLSPGSTKVPSLPRPMLAATSSVLEDWSETLGSAGRPAKKFHVWLAAPYFMLQLQLCRQPSAPAAAPQQFLSQASVISLPFCTSVLLQVT